MKRPRGRGWTGVCPHWLARSPELGEAALPEVGLENVTFSMRFLWSGRGDGLEFQDGEVMTPGSQPPEVWMSRKSLPKFMPVVPVPRRSSLSL